MDEWELREEAAIEEYERDIRNRTLTEIKENAIHAYFFYYGDDIEARIQSRIEAATKLIEIGFNGESLTSSIIAVELTIRWFLLRPLCEAAFLSDEVADILVKRILPPRRTGADREMLPRILQEWGSDVKALRLTDGSELWEKLTNEHFPARNGFVHRGESVEVAVAVGATDAAGRLLREAIRIVSPFKRKGKDGWAPDHCRRRLEDI
ncbi:MAG TPA: hypothetical protein P5572_02405 [Phycisphaerae bacterium]|nr:hypothetical protein [Phycisphaerae bacterium]